LTIGRAILGAAVLIAATPRAAKACDVPVTGQAARVFALAATDENRSFKFIWPVRGKVVQQLCSGSLEKHSDGIFIAVPAGTVVRAAADGTVLYAGNALKRFGTLIIVRHDKGWISAYANNRMSLVKRGEHVWQGRPIAVVGKGEVANYSQLHFEIRRNGEQLNPLDYLPKDSPKATSL
jgi:septal ring factor EnvC (AmiA/AmiB activator)